MQKSSARTTKYRQSSSQNAEKLRKFREQMADYARGERLRELRERTHESQDRAAIEIGVSPKTLRAWEHGGKIRWENAKRLASFYGVDPETLVSRELPELTDADDEPLTQLDRIEAQLSVVLAVLETQVGAELLEAVRQDIQQRQQPGPSTRRHRA